MRAMDDSMTPFKPIACSAWHRESFAWHQAHVSGMPHERGLEVSPHERPTSEDWKYLRTSSNLFHRNKLKSEKRPSAPPPWCSEVAVERIPFIQVSTKSAFCSLREKGPL